MEVEWIVCSRSFGRTCVVESLECLCGVVEELAAFGGGGEGQSGLEDAESRGLFDVSAVVVKGLFV